VAALDLDHEDLRAALIHVGQSFLALILSPTARSIYRIVIGEVQRFPELGRVFYQSGPALVTGRLVEFLQRADARGQVRVYDPVMAAKRFIGALQGPLHLRRLIGLIEQPDEAELQLAVLIAVDGFLRSYAADQPPPSGSRS
jgi:hypothetical protein